MSADIDAKATLEREILTLSDQIQGKKKVTPDEQAAIYHRNGLLAALAVVDAIERVSGSLDQLDARLADGLANISSNIATS